MTVLPVVARELSALSRRKSTYWTRTVSGLMALLVMLWLLVVARAHVSYAEMGKSLFFVVSSICFAFCVLVGMQATSDSVSEEKREGTLGLLFLTDLRGFDVITGKMTATSVGALLALFGVIPMLSLALLLGGVTLAQFGLTALVLVNTMFFSLSLGVFVSTLSENERRSMMGTFAGLVILLFGPAALVDLLRARNPAVDEIKFLSPLCAFTEVQSANTAFALKVSKDFWFSVISTNAIAWMLLAMASLILPRCVNPGSTMRFGRLRRWVQNFVYGRLEDRRKDRARLLDRNAFLWLASRERIKSKYAWGVIAIFAGLYGWIAMQFPNMMFDFAVAGVIMFLLHLVFKIWAASEVCSRLLQDRRSGALELLLSTPLSVREIADGQSQALGRLFLRPIAFVIGLEMLLLYYGLRTYGDVAADQDKVLLYVVAISTLLLDFWALKWVGLWLSLKGRSIERVLMGTLLRVLLVPWLIFALFIGMVTSAVLLQQREPNTTEVLGGWWVIALAVSALFGSSARKKFLREFRELAAGRFGSAEEAEQTPKPAAPRRKIRSPVFFRRHPITVSIFVVLAVLLLSGGIRGRYYHYKLNRALDRIRDEGKPVTLRDLVQYYPAVLPSENAFAMLEESRPNVASNRALPTRRNSTNVTSAEMESYRTLLSANRVVLEALWKLPEYRQGAFDQLTASGQFWIKSHIQSSYMAVLDADLMDLTQGGEAEVDRVSRTVFAMLAHARLLRDQPLSFAQERAQEAVQRLAGALTFVFKRDLLDEEALARMQKEVEGMKSGTNQLMRTLAVQRANMILSYQNPGLFMGMGFRVPSAVSLLEKIHATLGFGDQKLLEALEIFESAEEMATKPWPERLEAASKEEKWPALSWMGRTFYQTDLSTPFWRDAAYLANLHLIEAGIAAKRFEQKKGRLPRRLEELVPEFLAEVPIDPYTGEPLRSVLSDRLIIYSVGADRMDSTAPGAPVNVWADFRLPVE